MKTKFETKYWEFKKNNAHKQYIYIYTYNIKISLSLKRIQGQNTSCLNRIGFFHQHSLAHCPYSIAGRSHLTHTQSIALCQARSFKYQEAPPDRGAASSMPVGKRGRAVTTKPRRASHQQRHHYERVPLYVPPPSPYSTRYFGRDAKFGRPFLPVAWALGGRLPSSFSPSVRKLQQLLHLLQVWEHRDWRQSGLRARPNLGASAYPWTLVRARERRLRP